MKARILVLALSVMFVFAACASMSEQHKDAAIGGALGAGAGAIIGHQFGEGGRDKGALIGGALGAGSGLLYGQQQEKMQHQQAPQGYGAAPQAPAAGGDDFRNPYRSPAPNLCRGRWSWDPGAGSWVCAP